MGNCNKAVQQKSYTLYAKASYEKMETYRHSVRYTEWPKKTAVLASRQASSPAGDIYTRHQLSFMFVYATLPLYSSSLYTLPTCTLMACSHCRRIFCVYRVAQKIGTLLLYALTLPDINRFSKLFHCQNQAKICNNSRYH